jgi:hypothetical protein
MWRRIADFPLVALVIAIALFVLASWTAGTVGTAFETMAQPGRLIVRAAITIGIVFAVYKLAIAKLGEEPHDDLPVACPTTTPTPFPPNLVRLIFELGKGMH